VVYKITVMEEYTKLNDLAGVITVASVITAKAADLSQADTVAGSTSRPTKRRSAPRPWKLQDWMPGHTDSV
jgi:hypothetical protein